eukprot:CAMPEP_0183587094 /NCGR_PEP_ID=MMETSP0371-20130417/158348_1 /TAXON_ID=268820 /ORGANISM="Peridinium aciculiferum, Strain PAER-2" /LENGTH=348 /DNA_ID=CAMNT_0025798245 /DNA_START=75 /DNA_END=1121 /DNA_ORIENTATION=-
MSPLKQRRESSDGAAGRPASLAEIRQRRDKGASSGTWALRGLLAAPALALAALLALRAWAREPPLEDHEHYNEALRVLRNDGLDVADEANVRAALQLVEAALRPPANAAADPGIHTVDPRQWPPHCSRLGLACGSRPAEGATSFRQLSDEGANVSLVDLAPGQDVRLSLVEDLISEAELAMLLRKVEGLQFAVSPTNHEQGQEWRSSSTAFLSREDQELRPLLARVAALCDMPLDHLEAPQVVRYMPGDRYQPHMDSEGPHHRHWTLLLYLNDPGAGGATSFPLLGLKVLPAPRAGVLWQNLRWEPSLDHLVRDYRTLHDGQAPVGTEPKLALNIWVRGMPYSPSEIQ